MHRSLCDKREGENEREKIHDRNSTKLALRSHQSGLLRFSVNEENMMLKLMLILSCSLALASTECCR